jgi:thiol-disulfide isomerase/thioredoxin
MTVRPTPAAPLFALIIAVLLPALPASAAVSVGDKPQLDFKSLDGKTINSEMLQGKLVIVDFWATWCGPCMKAVPHMIQLQKKYPDNVQIIGISLDQDRSKLSRVLNEKKMTWPQYFDGRGWGNKYAKSWGVNSIPRIFILSPDGEVLWTGSPNASMDEALEQALQTHPPRPQPAQIARAAISTLRQVNEALDAETFDPLIELVPQIPPESADDRKVVAQAARLVKRLELLAAANPQLNQMLTDHPDILAHLKTIAATPAPATQPAETDNQPSVPQELIDLKLKNAQQAHEQGDDPVRAYKLYRWLVQYAPPGEAATLAAQRIAEYEADEQLFTTIKNTLDEEQAHSLLAMARNYLTAKKPDQAKQALEKIIAQFPDTPSAQLATEELASLPQTEP